MLRLVRLVLILALVALPLAAQAAVIPLWGLGNDTAPTMCTCGTATITAGGSDAGGQVVITAGTSGSCAVVFGQTYGTAPNCFVVDVTTANANGGKTVTTTTGWTYTIPTFTGAAANLGTDTLA